MIKMIKYTYISMFLLGTELGLRMVITGKDENRLV